MKLAWGGAPDVEKLSRRGDTEGLVRALGYEDSMTDRDGRVVDLGAAVRAAAAEALARVEDPSVVGLLMRAADDPEETVRVAAIRGLRERRDVSAVEGLVHVAANWSGPVRRASREEAVDALASVRDPDVPRRTAAKLMTRVTDLDEDDEAVLRRLAYAGGDDALRTTIDDLLEYLRGSPEAPRAGRLLVALSPGSVGPLIEALRDRRAAQNAAVALGLTHDARAVEPLCSLVLDAEDALARRAAAWALGEIRDPAGIQALLMATRDRDYGVRTEAIASFDHLGNAAIAIAVAAVAGLAGENGAAKAAQLPPAAPQEPSPGPASPAGPLLRRLLGR